MKLRREGNHRELSILATLMLVGVLGVLGLVYTVGDNVAHVVNPPKVVAIVIAGSERTYGLGDEIVIRMVFNDILMS